MQPQPYRLLGMFFLLAGVSLAGTGSRHYALSAAPFAWDEELADGSRFVRERGLRVTAALSLPVHVRGNLELRYEGEAYGTLVRHEGWDKAGFTIPDHYEDTVSGQIGMSHALVSSYLLSRSDVTVKATAGLSLDTWYRALNYFEIWIVPTVRYGLTFGANDDRWSVFLGATSIFDARQVTQTTKAPWNATGNTTISLPGETSPALAWEYQWKPRIRLRAGYAEYRFQHSKIVRLNSGVGIAQPTSTSRLLSVGIVRDF
jgi:hypothetical protein